MAKWMKWILTRFGFRKELPEEPLEALPISWTNQEMFDFVCRRLAAQKERSMAVGGDRKCLYRGPNGLRCAIGHCMTDDEYRASWDRRGTSSSMVKEHVSLLRDMDPIFLSGLQFAHDASDTSERLRKELTAIAGEFKLNDDVVEDIKEWRG